MLQLAPSNTKDFYEVEYNFPDMKITYRVYTWKTFLFIGWHNTKEETYDLADELDFNPSSLSEEVGLQAINYGDWIFDSIFKRYGYVLGTDQVSGGTVTYLKIAHKTGKNTYERYRILYSSTSSSVTIDQAAHEAGKNYIDQIDLIRKQVAGLSTKVPVATIATVGAILLMGYLDPEGITKAGLIALGAILAFTFDLDKKALDTITLAIEEFTQTKPFYSKAKAYGIKL